MRAFVTGSSGFLGQHLCRALLRRGDVVVGLVRDHVCSRDHFPPEERRTVVHGDLSSVERLERILAEHEIDCVFHLAAQAQVSIAKADPAGTLETNVRGTWNVLEACRRQKTAKLVIASSDKVYGDARPPYNEGMTVLPGGVYATSKACADLLAQSYIREFGRSSAIVRCGNIYGPGQRNRSTLVTETILSALEGKRPVIRSDGMLRRDYVFVEDAVDGYLKVADSIFQGPVNFGTGRPLSVLDVVRAVLKEVGSDLEPDVQCTARGEIADQYLNFQLAESLLGWHPAHTFEEGLKKTVPWYREHFHQ